MAADQKIIDKITSIRAKAASTTFQAERESFEAGALRMMNKYGITESDLVVDPWAGVKVTYGRQTDDWPRANTYTRRERTYKTNSRGETTVTFSENNYYLPGKRALLEAVARMFSCTVAFSVAGSKAQTATIFGARRDDVMAAYSARIDRIEAAMPSSFKRIKSAHTAYIRGYADGLEGINDAGKNFDAYQSGYNLANGY